MKRSLLEAVTETAILKRSADGQPLRRKNMLQGNRFGFSWRAYLGRQRSQALEG
jgi:hypothetical protein